MALLDIFRSRQGRLGTTATDRPPVDDVDVGAGALRPGASVDEPVAGELVDRSPAYVRGWALLPSESVARVELTVDGRPLGHARIGLSRPDVAAAFPCAEAATSGWEYELGADPGLPVSGAVTLGGVVHGSTGATIALPDVAVELADGWSIGPSDGPVPHASMDEPAAGARVDRLPVYVGGWATLPSESVARVELTVDGRPLGPARVGLPRPDVAAAVTGIDGAGPGWEFELGPHPALPGSGSVTLGGVVHGSAGGTIALPSVTIELAGDRSDEEPSVPCPGASVDEPVADACVDRLPAFVRGWAMFPSQSVTRVELTLDGRPIGPARIGLPRPDIAAACACTDAPISGWEYELGIGPDLPASGTVTLGGVVHGSAGGTIALPDVTIDLGVQGHALHPSAAGAHFALRPATPAASGTGLNVLVFTHSLEYGGAQLYLLELLERLGERGLRFTVVSPADGPLRERFEQSGSRVHLSPLPAPWEHRLYDARIAELTAFAAPQAFDLVIGNTVLVFHGAEIAARLGLPSILAVHESFDPRTYWALHMAPQDPALFERMASALRSASAIVFEAAATRELFVPYAAPERLLTMPFGIDLAAIGRFRSTTSRSAARAALGIGTDQQVVLCLGTIEGRKSQTSLTRAFGTIADRHPDALLVLVGEQAGTSIAPYNHGLAEHVRRAGMVDRVVVAPLTSDPFAWHVAADVLVCASDIESLPRVILEAMAFGTLVVSTDIFGIPEVIEHGVTGFLCGSRDEEAIADALSEALVRRPGHQVIRAAAADRVRERHDADDYATRFLDLIDTLVDAERRQPACAAGA